MLSTTRLCAPAHAASAAELLAPYRWTTATNVMQVAQAMRTTTIDSSSRSSMRLSTVSLLGSALGSRVVFAYRPGYRPPPEAAAVHMIVLIEGTQDDGVKPEDL